MVKSKQIEGLIVKDFDDIFPFISRKEIPLSESNPSKFTILTRRYKGLTFSALDSKAKAFASIDWKLKKGNKVIDKSDNDRIYNLLIQPNPLFTDFEFRYLYAIYKYSLGEVFIYVARDKLGIPNQLWILPSQFMRIVWETDRKKRAKGQLINKYELLATTTNGGDIKLEFTPDEIIYVRTPSPIDIYRGYGELQANLLESDIHTFSKMYIRDFYKNGAVPQGVLSTEKSLTEEEIRRLQRQWEEKYKGKSNSWKVAILSGGLKFEKISIDPTTSSYIEQSKWTRDDILAIFKVPISKLGYTENVNKSTAREQNAMFSKDVIAPEVKRYTELINNQLFNLPVLSKYNLKFYNIVPKDEELQIEKARVGATFGAITINELRGFLGLEPINEGDELVTPLNQGGRPTGSKKPSSDNQQDGDKTSDDTKYIEELFKQIDGVVDELL